MNIKPALVLFLSLVCLLIASAAEPAGNVSAAASPAASLEERYIASRDGFIRQFAQATDPVADRPALAELERQMRAVVGPVTIEGFPGQGRINLLTLRPEPGFAQVDGLRFDSDGEALVVTTEVLLNRYLAERPELPKTVSELSKTGDFYRRVFHADAGVVCYTDVPVRSGEDGSFAHAALGVSAQDIGPFIPDEIFVFVTRGNRVLLVSAPAAVAITEIPECRSEWDRFAKKRDEALHIYRSSQLEDRKAFENSLRYGEQGFEAYRRCYEREAQNRPFFPSLKRQAQSIVDRLQRD
ncbi:MAG: hypothetical protein JXI32_04375 [Deltaproteobacteria bacterium]|nr:hypothetical protein [Deltaproteobacteria bacterium]